MRRFVTLVGCVLVACGQGQEQKSGTQENVGETRSAMTTCTSGPFVEGVDVSDGQGNIDWKAVKGDGIGFGIAKATQGTYNTQATFAGNWANMKAAGVVRGAYHFFDPTEDGTAQANYFLGVVGAIEPGDLPPMLDIECPDGDPQCLGFSGGSGAASSSDITTRMWAWIHTVENATGRKPLIYSFGSYFADNGVDTTGLDAYPLNIAYPVSGNCFNFPGPWSAATIWQWSFTGSVSGIGATVDRDRFLGTASQLESFTNGTSSLSEVSGNAFLTAANWKDGHTEVFAVKTGGQATHSWTQGTTDTWNNMDDLKGTAACGLAAVVWPPTSHDTVEVFDPTASGSTQHLWFSNGAWNAFQDFGGTNLSELSTVAWPDGHVEVFALGGDGAIWHNWWTSSNAWSGWQSMQGSLATGVSPIVWNDGHVEIFATDAKGAVWHNWTGSKGWNGWASLGGALASRPAVARWADGHMELFGTGLDGHLSHAWWNATGWTAFATLNAETTIQGVPSVLVYPAYGPEVFARDATGQLNHMWVDTSQPGGWSKWAADFKQAAASDPFAWMRADGQAEVFLVDAKGDLLKSLHSGTTWSAFASIASGVDPCDEPPPSGTDGGTAAADGGTSHGGGGGSWGAGGTGGSGGTPGGGGTETGGGNGAEPSAGAGSSSGCAVAGAGSGDGSAVGISALFLALAALALGRRSSGRLNRA